jgi:stage IV sporulation protein FB
MSLFVTPPPTRYDLQFTLFGIPVRVHPLFWLMTILFGASSSSLFDLLIWIVVVFISILAHELGHALAMRRYGQHSHIVLHIAGGLTVPESEYWGGQRVSVSRSPSQEIFISLAGPLTGFLLAALVMAGVVALGGSIVMAALFGVIPFPMAFLPEGSQILNSIVLTFLWVNIFWGLINLMPVYPLDGGNITRYLLLKMDPWDGVRKSIWVSVIAGGIVAVAGLFLMGSIYVALFFGYLAFLSYQMLGGPIRRGF